MNRLPTLSSDEARLPPLPSCVAQSANGWHCGWLVDEAWITTFLHQRASRRLSAPTLRARLETAAVYLSMAADCDVRAVFVATKSPMDEEGSPEHETKRSPTGEPFLALCSTQPALTFLRRPTSDQLDELCGVLGDELRAELRWEEGVSEEEETAKVFGHLLTSSSGSEMSEKEKPRRWASVRRKLALPRRSTDTSVSLESRAE